MATASPTRSSAQRRAARAPRTPSQSATAQRCAAAIPRWTTRRRPRAASRPRRPIGRRCSLCALDGASGRRRTAQMARLARRTRVSSSSATSAQSGRRTCVVEPRLRRSAWRQDAAASLGRASTAPPLTHSSAAAAARDASAHRTTLRTPMANRARAAPSARATYHARVSCRRRAPPSPSPPHPWPTPFASTPSTTPAAGWTTAAAAGSTLYGDATRSFRGPQRTIRTVAESTLRRWAPRFATFALRRAPLALTRRCRTCAISRGGASCRLTARMGSLASSTLSLKPSVPTPSTTPAVGWTTAAVARALSRG
mmetsp:Transcript_23195/g.68455  ORF Transcript_23195/g.68455 Transcript_23195/m.68455 type:complete len:312 (+) Transcript_23195:1306-2241(+)